MKNEELLFIPRPEIQTPWDGFDLLYLVNYIRRTNLAAKNSGEKEPHPLYKTFIPLDWRKDGKHWFYTTEISKCLRWAGYKALGEKGIPLELEAERRMEKGTHDHYRLEREFGLVALSKEIRIFDPDNFIYGKCDILARNFITGELFVVDFKTIEEWVFRSRLKREGLPSHLKKTNFYPPFPDDETQIMLYIRMWRMLIRDPEIFIRFGLLIYENKNNPNERKAALVEYDEKVIEKFFVKLQELQNCLSVGENIPPYIPPEAYVHTICPFRKKCPIGQLALGKKMKKRNIPLWKIFELKRRAKQTMPQLPAKPSPQGELALSVS